MKVAVRSVACQIKRQRRLIFGRSLGAGRPLLRGAGAFCLGGGCSPSAEGPSQVPKLSKTPRVENNSVRISNLLLPVLRPPEASLWLDFGSTVLLCGPVYILPSRGMMMSIEKNHKGKNVHWFPPLAGFRLQSISGLLSLVNAF